jgi:acetyl-CoA C-acetyltransferase
VLELADIGVDDLDMIDVYSCFPSAVQVAANELGLPLGTRTDR